MTAVKRIPAYQRMYEDLKNHITDGIYQTGDMLPPENELEKLYGVSRTTVRKAVELLLRDGLISVKQGFGTQVVSQKSVQSLNYITSVSQTLKNMGYAVGVKSMYIEKCKASEDVSKALEVPLGEPVFCVYRIQTANGKPVAIAQNYILCSVCPGLDNESERIVSLYEYIRSQYNIEYTAVKDAISATNASFADSQMLDVPPCTALISIRRVCYYHNAPVEFDRVHIIGKKYEFEVCVNI